MRVLCIAKKLVEITGKKPGMKLPVFGDELNVIGEWSGYDREYYYFAEYGNDIVFNKKSFIPISDIDEKDLRRDRAVSKFLNIPQRIDFNKWFRGF